MKSNNGFRANEFRSDPGETRKAVKLPPLKKSGKEKHHIYKGYEEEDYDPELNDYKKRESAFDYFDDEEADF